MKHAGAAALEGLAGLIAQVRQRAGLVERKPGIFYRKGQAFLHFHEHGAEIFADLRQGADWTRLPAANTNLVLAAIDAAMK